MSKKLTYAGLMQDAADNWPEDEASITAGTYRERMEHAQDDEAERKWALEWFAKDVSHMHKVFARETDGEALIARYNAHLVKLGAPRIGKEAT